MKPKSNSISGGCLCGEVEFTFTLPINGAPTAIAPALSGLTVRAAKL